MNDPYNRGGGQPGYPPPHGYPPHPGQAGHGSPPPYPGQHPYPPYPPPRKSNTGLVIGIVAGIALLVAAGLALYFTGAFGSSRPTYPVSAVPAISTSDIVGTWDRSSTPRLDGAPCQRSSPYIAIFTADGRRGDGSVGTPATQVPLTGRYRIEGNILVEISVSGTERRQLVHDVTPNSFQLSDVDYYEKNGPGGGYHYIRCGGGNGAAPARPAPSGSLSSGEIASRLDQEIAATRPRLPLQAGPITITNIMRSSERQLMVRATYAQTLSQPQWTILSNGLRQSICNSGTGALIRSGAIVALAVYDRANQPFYLNVTSC